MEIVTKYDPVPWFFGERDKVDGVVTSCGHVGDKYGVLPKNATTKEGGGATPNAVQKRLYSELVKTLKKIGTVPLLIIMGDTAEGKQLKVAGVPIQDSDTDTQGNWAAQLYEETFYEYCNPERVIMVMGTAYHVLVGIGGNLDFQVAEKISRISDVTFGYPNLRFLLGSQKRLWDVRHRISVASVNLLMPLEKSFRSYYRMLAEDGTPIPDVICRSHNHGIVFEPTNVSSGKNRRYALVSPCMKASDIYGETLPYPSSPKVGVMTISQGDRLHGEYHPFDIDSVKVRKI